MEVDEGDDDNVIGVAFCWIVSLLNEDDVDEDDDDDKDDNDNADADFCLFVFVI